jgi:hypothetical protein
MSASADHVRLKPHPQFLVSLIQPLINAIAIKIEPTPLIFILLLLPRQQHGCLTS